MQRGFGYQNRRNAGFSPASLFTGGVQGAWYDPSDATTLFTDRAGTTPCGTPGGGSVVPVGAMLDKRAAGYSVFFDGSNDNLQTPNSAAFQFGTGDFTIEGWIYVTGALSGYRMIAQCAANSSWTTGWSFAIFNDRLNLWLNGNNIALSGAGAILANTWQHVAVTRSGTTVTLWVNGSSVATATNSDNLVPTRAVSIGDQDSTAYGYPFQGYISNLRVVKGTAVYTGAFTPSGPLSPITGTSLLTCGTSWTGNPAITKNGDARVDGLNPFTASPVGNHAIAANDTTARPELRARVNLLTYSEDFGNAAWGKLNASIAVNSTTAPDGTTTADTFDATAAPAYVFSTFAAAATTYTMSVYAKANTANQIRLDFVTSAFANGGTCVFTLTGSGSAGSITQFGGSTGYVASITSVGNGWYRCSLTGAATAATWIYELTNLASGQSVFIWGAQLIQTNEFPANTYQRIVDANTYDAVGFPRYLVANGTSSAMSTPGNVNLSGTDKVTVFAGVRKLSDAAAGIVAELSANGDSNNGAFYVSAAAGAASNYAAVVRGTSLGYYLPATFAAPITNVVSMIGDIAQSTLATEIVPRINGTVVQTGGVGGSGTGNFGTYPLFIGARNNGTGLFLNGNIYSLIVVGSAVSAGQISATEQWVAGKTGITI